MSYQLITRDSNRQYIIHDYTFATLDRADRCAKWLRTGDPKYDSPMTQNDISACPTLQAPIVGYVIREYDTGEWVKYRGNVRDIHKFIPKD